MVLPHQVIQGLPELRYKGLKAPPYDAAGFTFSHRQGVKVYPYIDGAGHESTGLDPFPLSVNMFFLNTLQVGAFPDLWLQWWDILQNGSPGKLEHPLIGEVDAVVLGGDVQLAANVTAGVIANINFTNTLVDPEAGKTQNAIAVSLEDAAIAADAAAEAIDVKLPSQASVVTLEQLAGIVRGLLAYSTLLSDYVNKAQAWVDTMIQLSAESQEHIKYDAIEKLTIVYNALGDTANSVKAIARQTGSFITIKETTLDSFASDRGNDLKDIISLNPSALSAPSVPAGTMLRFYV